MDELRKKAVTGSVWMVAMRATVNLLGIFSTVILARLLNPDDFGVVALAGSAYVFFALFGQLGFDLPLIQMRDAERSHYDTAWTANILVGLVIATALIISAKPAAAFFNDARIENVIYSFSLLSLAKGAENVGVVNFRKQLAFKGEFLYFVIPKISSLVVGISAAFILRNYWALVIGMISAQFTTLLYSHFSQPFRPRLSLVKFRELFRFTKWMLGIKMLRYLTFNGIEIVLGRLRGPEAVGFYGVASQVAYLPSTELAAPAKRALFPSFSTISSDTVRVRSAFIKVFAVTVLITMPAAFGIFAISEPLVAVVFGAKWLDSAPLLMVLAMVGLLDVTNNLFEPVLMARAALRTLFLVLATHTVILLVSSIVLVSRFGAPGAAYAMLLSAVVAIPLYTLAARREIGFSIADLLASIWRPLTASVAMTLAVRETENLLVPVLGSNPLTLIALVAVGVVAYCGVILLLWLACGRPQGPELTLLEAVLERLRSRRKVAAGDPERPPVSSA